MALAHSYHQDISDERAQPRALDFIVNDMHCAGCMRKIEKGLGAEQGIKSARCNLSTKRVHVEWAGDHLNETRLVELLANLGFEAAPFDPKLLATNDEAHAKRLLRSMAVAGFAAANVMLLSVSVWSGLATDMDAATQELFHWLSALIAIPAVAYAGQPFFRSAIKALNAKSLNMDVPISLAVILATGMSLFETIRGGEEVYFDASVSLLFFLLIGRYLDVRMRERACSAAQNLLSLRAVYASRIEPDGNTHEVPVKELSVGDRVSVASGARFPADGQVLLGTSEVDMSLVTGESLPQKVEAGAEVFAGTLNLGAPLQVEVSKRDEDSLLADIVRLMEAAEQGRAGYVRLADRIAKYYAPAVHILAAVTFVGWLAFGASAHAALMAAIAVLIVTCPCALGLAVPVVQVVASGKLLKRGILVKSADGLERLADVDQIVFDKTGTLTLGEPQLVDRGDMPEGHLALAKSLAQASSHPLSKATARAFADMDTLPLEDIEEVPGQGLKARYQGVELRLGQAAWVGAEASGAGTELWFRKEGEAAHRLDFADELKKDAVAVLDYLAHDTRTHLLSGDTDAAVASVASKVKLDEAHARQHPSDKIAYLNQLATEGAKTLMVGDGLNDAPALRAAHVSMSPAEASDISQTAADFVIQGKSLSPVVEALRTAKFARALILQNFSLAFLYNAIAIPLAVAGFVTPLVAAIAMSSSSLVVTGNAMRLTWRKG